MRAVRLVRSAVVLLLAVACAPAQAPNRDGRALAARASASSSSRPLVAPSVASAPPSASVAAPHDPEVDAPIASVDPKEGIGVALGPAGHLGAWLALGPFVLPKGSSPEKFRPIDEAHTTPRFDASAGARIDQAVLKKQKRPELERFVRIEGRWGIARSGDGPIDLEAQFHTYGRPAIAYLATTLRLPSPEKIRLLISGDDGVEVFVDGTRRYAVDLNRPYFEDQDYVSLDLAAGDHPILLRLRQHDGGWASHVRIVDESLRPPRGARTLLSGAPADRAPELAGAMSWISIARHAAPLDARDVAWSIEARVRFPEGAPMGVPLTVTGGIDAPAASIGLEAPLGVVPLGVRATGELSAPIVRWKADAPAIAAIEKLASGATVRVDVATRHLELPIHIDSNLESSLDGARRWLADDANATKLPPDVRATIEHQRARLASFVARDDRDTASLTADAAELRAWVDDASAGRDPFAARTGVLRAAHVARADGKPQPVAVYVPPIAKKAKPHSLPLYVGLHGMNGGPLAMLRVFFGGDDENKSMFELDRAMAPYRDIGAFVIAPHAHGNAMYRQLGEDEVLDALQWALDRYPAIDPDRVYITGFSMGGIGAASIPFHHPDLFAAAQPLCGYHSYWIRRDVKGRPQRPWEAPLIDERSNVSWIDNASRLPLWIVHGKYDTPEENSGVLIAAYEKRKLSIKHDHPEKGHDVWGWAYADNATLKWFAGRRRAVNPTVVRFATTRPRWGDDAWVHLDALATSTGFSKIEAVRKSNGRLSVSTRDVDALHLDRVPKVLGDDAVELAIDGQKLEFGPGVPIVAHREAALWKAGPLTEPLRKQGHVTGPIRDVWHEPLRFIVGEDDPLDVEANRQLARALASIRWGTDVQYPIESDRDGDPAALPDRSLVLIGNARDNRYIRALDSALPIHVIAKGQPGSPEGAVMIGASKIEGRELGAVFVYPHPRDHSKYVLVIGGVDPLATLRGLSLPELLPDFMVWDESLAPARGQTLLSFGAARAAGYFDLRWALPAHFEDPLADALRRGARNEHDGAAYLP